MRCTVREILDANSALSSMRIRGEMPYHTLRSLHRLRDTLGKEVGVASESQIGLVESNNGKIDVAGKIVFLREDDKEAFHKAWEEIRSTEIEMDVEPVDLSALVEIIRFDNADADLDALEKFIIFEKEGEHG